MSPRTYFTIVKRRSASDEYPQYIFWGEIRKISCGYPSYLELCRITRKPHLGLAKVGLNSGVVLFLSVLKGFIFLKNRHFTIQEMFIKLIYGTNRIIKCGTWQPVKFQLVSRSWNVMIFYRISELMLPTLIQRCDKKSFQKWETNSYFKGCQMPHFVIVLILYIKLLNLSWT